MTPTPTPTPRTDDQCYEATPEEMCYGTLKHYEDVSMKACHWSNQVPQAIEYWFLKRPQLERDLAACQEKLERARALLKEGADGFGRVLVATSDDKAVRNWQKRCRLFLAEAKERDER